MGGMGPPPEPGRRRRNATVAMTQLPAEGRQGPPPAWPLPPNVRMESALRRLGERIELAALDAKGSGDKAAAAQDRLLALQEQAEVLAAELKQIYALELALWEQLWAMPQAVLWQRQRWTREVAQYARWKVRGELGDLNAAKEARQLSDRLLLTPLALLRGRCEVVADQVAHRRTGASAGRSRSAATRRRLKIADPNAEDPGGCADSAGDGQGAGGADTG